MVAGGASTGSGHKSGENDSGSSEKAMRRLASREKRYYHRRFNELIARLRSEGQQGGVRTPGTKVYRDRAADSNVIISIESDRAETPPPPIAASRDGGRSITPGAGGLARTESTQEERVTIESASVDFDTFSITPSPIGSVDVASSLSATLDGDCDGDGGGGVDGDGYGGGDCSGGDVTVGSSSDGGGSTLLLAEEMRRHPALVATPQSVTEGVVGSAGDADGEEDVGSGGAVGWRVDVPPLDEAAVNATVAGWFQDGGATGAAGGTDAGRTILYPFEDFGGYGYRGDLGAPDGGDGIELLETFGLHSIVGSPRTRKSRGLVPRLRVEGDSTTGAPAPAGPAGHPVGSAALVGSSCESLGRAMAAAVLRGGSGRDAIIAAANGLPVAFIPTGVLRAGSSTEAPDGSHCLL